MQTSNKEQGWVISVSLSWPEPGNNTADAERLIQALGSVLQTGQVYIDYSVLQKLPKLLRECNYRLRCVLFPRGNSWLVTGLTSAENNVFLAGLALDLGTTKCAMRLVDLETGTIWAEKHFDNPQIFRGADILTRMHWAAKPQGQKELKNLIVGKINKYAEELACLANIELNDIYLLLVAGNTAMTHLFLGLPPNWMIKEPYTPVMNNFDTLKATELDLHLNSGARVFVFPNVGSYFGGDVLSGLLYSGLCEKEELSLFVDVGTNAEVCLGNAHWLLCCAGAAGPALESGASSLGMRAGPGVIDSVYLDEHTNDFIVHVLGEGKACGICGSGLLDLAAELFLKGMLDSKGKLIPEKCGWRFEQKSGQDYLLLVKAEDSETGKDLRISQLELDSLIRSKAAMYAILETAASAVGLCLQDVQRFYVAGTFGNYIRPESAIALGMLPDLPLDNFVTLGNSSLEGATSLLCCRDNFQQLFKIKEKITYLELNVSQDFMQRFSAAKFLPHTEAGLFPNVRQKSRAKHDLQAL